jgi:hypothetical protein
MKNVNDVIYAVAKRAGELSNMTMDELRLTAGYNCDNMTQAREAHRGMNRGELVELVLTEEFCEEFPKEIEQQS